MMSDLNDFMLGALALAAFIVGFFFTHYYRLSRDRFFALFGGAFGLLGVQWTLVGLLQPDAELKPWIYLIRLVAFLIILYAIFDKNRRRD